MRNLNIVVLGVTGMLGHKVFQRLRDRFDGVWGVSRDAVTSPRFEHVTLLQDPRILQGIDARNWTQLEDLLRRRRPDYIVNCIGIIKQRPEANSPVPSLLINALLPHRLADAASQWGGRLIQFSTDCVFSGNRGAYREDDPPDPQDLYGRTKLLGEVTASNALTLRTSMIGRELAGFRSLLEWFLAQRGGTVQGYKGALYSGVTSNHLADVVTGLIESEHSLTGLYQVAGGPISKYDLLCLIRTVFHLNVEIRPVAGEVCDRTMLADHFIASTGYHCPSWRELIEELYNDPTPYEEWRTKHHETIQTP